jgi:glycosyltransferase involved in cell wall biosynthesis
VRPTALRVALVADLSEERWPSMDLVADMLFEQLRSRRYAGRFEVTLLRPPLSQRGRGIGRYLNRYWDYPRWLRARAGEFDLFHVIDHSYAHLVHVLPRKRTVVTCHDVDAFMPLVDPTVIPTRLPRAVTRMVLSGMRKAACITCVSNATRHEVERFQLADPEKLIVVPNGVHPAMTAAPDGDAATQVERLLGQRHAGDVELLHVGTCIPRKRIDLLLEVFAAVAAATPQVRLLKAGGRLTAEQQAHAQALNVASRIVQLPYLEPQALAALYRRADTVLVTSSREGFGLPVVEALAVGTPVVATDLPVLREVGGSAVAYAPLGAVGAWRDAAIEQVTAAHKSSPDQTVDRAPQDSPRHRRMSQAARFSWPAAAAQLASVYEQVVANHDIVQSPNPKSLSRPIVQS